MNYQDYVKLFHIWAKTHYNKQRPIVLAREFTNYCKKSYQERKLSSFDPVLAMSAVSGALDDVIIQSKL